MIKFKKKLMLAFVIGIIASTTLFPTALAGPSFSGSSTVYPGRSYTYTVKASENASSIFCTASTSGIIGSQSKTFYKDSSTGFSQSITASTTITVTIPADAAIGSTGTISVSGTYSKVDAEGNASGPFGISGSKTITVVAPPTPPPPTEWELAVKDINKVEEGGSITIEMDPEKQKEIVADIEAFQAIKDRQIVMTVDYGTFKVIIDGKEIGEIPAGSDDINLGYAMQPAERDTDMIVFIPNNSLPFIYAATYVMPPNIPVPEDMIYVYRYYASNDVTEYVQDAGTDEEGNVLVYVFAPGKYIVSAASIDGSVGNMDIDTFMEMFATPTPSPSPTPTPTPTPTLEPTATPEPETSVFGGTNMLTIILAGVLIVLIGAFVWVVVRSRSQLKSSDQPEE